jgi:hypothetical protein
MTADTSPGRCLRQPDRQAIILAESDQLEFRVEVGQFLKVKRSEDGLDYQRIVSRHHNRYLLLRRLLPADSGRK